MKPLLSILCMVMTLLILVFLQMRERHINYAINKLNQKHKKKEQELNKYFIDLYQLKDPRHLQRKVKKKALRPLKKEQIIYMGEG